MAWPIWSEPVTLGGGIGTTKGSFPPSKFGLKNPWDSHLHLDQTAANEKNFLSMANEATRNYIESDSTVMHGEINLEDRPTHVEVLKCTNKIMCS